MRLILSLPNRNNVLASAVSAELGKEDNSLWKFTVKAIDKEEEVKYVNS